MAQPKPKGRPSKLSDREWAEIGRRLASGEKAPDLAKEFKISRPSIIARFSDKVMEIRNTAEMLASVETKIEKMPLSDAMSVRSLADQLKGISRHLAKAAESGARVSNTLSDIAEKHANRLALRVDEEGGLMLEELKPVAALIQTANQASTIGMGLLAANKGKEGALDQPGPGNTTLIIEGKPSGK